MFLDKKPLILFQKFQSFKTPTPLSLSRPTHNAKENKKDWWLWKIVHRVNLIRKRKPEEEKEGTEAGGCNSWRNVF
jgi:hypothetical protein